MTFEVVDGTKNLRILNYIGRRGKRQRGYELCHCPKDEVGELRTII